MPPTLTGSDACVAIVGEAFMTVTPAVSFPVTSGPPGGSSLAAAVFVTGAVTSARLHSTVELAPGASSAIAFAQSGACASATATLESGTSPVLVTTSVNDAADPDTIVCDFGDFVIAIPGFETRTDSFASLQVPVTGLLLASPE